MNAISLVFGTSERGVDLPEVSDVETISTYVPVDQPERTSELIAAFARQPANVG